MLMICSKSEILFLSVSWLALFIAITIHAMRYVPKLRLIRLEAVNSNVVGQI